MPKLNQVVADIRSIVEATCHVDVSYEQHPGDVTVNEFCDLRYRIDMYLQKHLGEALDASDRRHRERHAQQQADGAGI